MKDKLTTLPISAGSLPINRKPINILNTISMKICACFSSISLLGIVFTARSPVDALFDAAARAAKRAARVVRPARERVCGEARLALFRFALAEEARERIGARRGGHAALCV